MKKLRIAGTTLLLLAVAWALAVWWYWALIGLSYEVGTAHFWTVVALFGLGIACIGNSYEEVSHDDDQDE